MSTPEDFKDIYTDELKDLWSANDQMQRLLKKVSTKASDAQLKEMLTSSQAGIAKHTETLKALIVGQGEKATKEHCKGMEGLVTEATKHIVEEGPKKGPLLDDQSQGRGRIAGDGAPFPAASAWMRSVRAASRLEEGRGAHLERRERQYHRPNKCRFRVRSDRG
jgi:hypothetical protein